MANRSRSGSPMVGDMAYEYPHSRSPLGDVSEMDLSYDLGDGMSSYGTSGRHVNPLYQATVARKRAEQDTILLANRIKMLRREEEMTKRKIEDTEKKTKEIFDVRRRNEERRLQKELEDAKMEQEIQALRERQLREKAETEKKISEKQRNIADRKHSLSHAIRQQREVNLQAIQDQTEAAEREVWARAERVRRELAQHGRNRARSEGAKQEAARNMHYDKIVKEEEMRQARVHEITQMEREEAQLIARLAQSQERHRTAYMQLEDAIKHDKGGGGASSRSGACTPLSVEDCYGPGAASRAAANAEIARAATGRGIAAAAARPPRPRGPPLERGPASSTPTGSQARSSSAGKRRDSRFGALSSCSTASGEHDASRGHSSAGSTPTGSSAAVGGGAAAGGGSAAAGGGAAPSKAEDAQPLKYTTVDGTALEIPEEEEDLDLAMLLSA